MKLGADSKITSHKGGHQMIIMAYVCCWNWINRDFLEFLQSFSPLGSPCGNDCTITFALVFVCVCGEYIFCFHGTRLGARGLIPCILDCSLQVFANGPVFLKINTLLAYQILL